MKRMKKLFPVLALLGLRRGKIIGLANAKAAPNYKEMHAEAIGLGAGQTDIPDDEQVAAHHKHMAAMNDLAESIDADTAGAMASANAKERETLLANAVSEGRIAEADLAAWETKFTADHDAAKVALANVKKPASSEAETDLANEKKRADALRKEAIELHLSNAVAAGKITQAQRGEWETKFAADFDGTKTALSNARPVIKTAPKTANLGARNNDITDATLADEKGRALKVQELVNAKQKDGMEYTAAFNAVRHEHPQLFEAMKQPEPKK